MTSVLHTVAVFREPWEAHFLRLRLLAGGIAATVAHEHHIWMNWQLSLALGGVKVQVPRAALADAEAVLARCRSGEFRAQLAEELGDLDDPCCPACGSVRYTSRSSIPMLILAFAALIWGGAIFPARASIRHCRACGTLWRDGLRGARMLGRSAATPQPG